MVRPIRICNAVPEKFCASHVTLPTTEHSGNVSGICSALAVGGVGHVEQLRVVVVVHGNTSSIVVLMSAAVIQGHALTEVAGLNVSAVNLETVQAPANQGRVYRVRGVVGERIQANTGYGVVRITVIMVIETLSCMGIASVHFAVVVCHCAAIVVNGKYCLSRDADSCGATLWKGYIWNHGGIRLIRKVRRIVH